jgi:histidinol-phosphate aminotransferase
MDVGELERKTIASMAPYESSIVVAAECKMDQNESPYDVPNPTKAKILRRMAQIPLNRYPDPSYPKLRKIIARRLGVSADNVAVGSGVDDLLYCVSLAYLEQGDKAVYPVPSFGMYRICCSITGARAMEVPLNPDFSLPGSFIGECKNAKLVFLCRPNNPTGTSAPLLQVEKIIRSCRGLVCIDEAYADFADDDCAHFLKCPNVLLFRTFSKAFSAAGARIGYAIAGKQVIAAMNKVRLPWNLSIFSQIAAEELLFSDFADQRVREVKAQRKRLMRSLRLMGAQPVESNANFILFRVPDAKTSFRRMLADGVLVRCFSSPALENYLRVTVGTKIQNDCFLRALLRAACDAVFFDIDGTLVDVSRSYQETIRLAAQEMSGKAVSKRLVTSVKALPGMNNDWDATVEVLRRVGVLASRKQVLPIFQRLYLGENGNGLILREKPLVDASLIRKIRVPTAMVTGRPKEEARAAMRMLGLPSSVPLIAMEDTQKGKPSPAPLLLAKKRLGAVLPAYIGDSPDDREAALRAGCAFVAIGKGKAQGGEFARFESANAAIRGLFA